MEASLFQIIPKNRNRNNLHEYKIFTFDNFVDFQMNESLWFGAFVRMVTQMTCVMMRLDYVLTI